MESISNIVRNIRGKVLGGAKVPHGISNPVLRNVNGTIYISFFVYLYSKENLLQNKYGRPSSWVIADIESGEIIKEFDCRNNDFSSEAFGTLYDFNDSEHIIPTKETIIENYELFDTIRRDIKDNNDYISSYKKYFDSIISMTPVEYRCFYKELNGI